MHQIILNLTAVHHHQLCRTVEAVLYRVHKQSVAYTYHRRAPKHSTWYTFTKETSQLVTCGELTTVYYSHLTAKTQHRVPMSAPLENKEGCCPKIKSVFLQYILAVEISTAASCLFHMYWLPSIPVPSLAVRSTITSRNQTLSLEEPLVNPSPIPFLPSNAPAPQPLLISPTAQQMLQHRSPAPAGGRRQAGGGARQPKAFGVAVDRAPIILTRAELQRRTRERSRLAALKIAEEHGKARKGGKGERMGALFVYTKKRTYVYSCRLNFWGEEKSREKERKRGI